MANYNSNDFKMGVLSNMRDLVGEIWTYSRPCFDIQIMLAYLQITKRLEIDKENAWGIVRDFPSGRPINNTVYVMDDAYIVSDRFKPIKESNEIVHKYIFETANGYDGLLLKSDDTNEIAFYSRSMLAKERFVAMLPVILNIDVGGDDELGAFCKSFITETNDTGSRLKLIAKKFSDVFMGSEWYKERARMALLNFSKTGYNNKVERLKETLDYENRNKMSAYNTYMNCLVKCKKANDEYMYIKSHKLEEDTALLEIFDSHDNIHFINIDGSEIKYSVVDTIEYFDEDLLEGVIKNAEYPERARKVLEWMYLKDNGQFLAESSLGIRDLAAIYPYKDIWYEHPNAIKHPHLYEFQCPGDNRQIWEEALSVGDYDVAIEQSVQATKNISWGDGAVVETLMYHIDGEYWYKECIRLNDGSFTSPDKVFEEEIDNGKED